MLLTEEQEQVRDAARKFAQLSLAPHSAEWDRQAIFPRAALVELGKLGFMGMTVPRNGTEPVRTISHMRFRWRKSQPATGRFRRL